MARKPGIERQWVKEMRAEVDALRSKLFDVDTERYVRALFARVDSLIDKQKSNDARVLINILKGPFRVKSGTLKKCPMVMAWHGPCDRPTVDGKRCEHHQEKVCCACGKPATRECTEYGSCGMVCGAYLCDLCKHKSHP